MKITKIKSNMTLPDVKFTCSNDKEGEGTLKVTFSDPNVQEVPYLEVIFNKPIPYIMVNAFNRFSASTVKESVEV